ncbi:MAG: Protein-glutamine gamma-glutamyltransferase [Opitutia bacterium UBA7350]|nr:MAG: Protein-glutamine gamma-glutamyltransferase [Opitutae bacterium UBA7350]
MQFSLRHLTQYTYSDSVSDSMNDVHLCPVSDDLQICHEFDLRLDPACRVIMRRLDFYINQVHHFEILEPHDRLSVEAISRVETFEDTRDFRVHSSPAALPELKLSERFYDFLSPSERVQLLPRVIHEIRELFPGGLVEVQATVLRIMNFIYSEFIYDTFATAVETPFEQVFHERKGVCQDFAHAMLAFCRALGIPARYVSGYFYLEKGNVGTAEDNTQSHAWVECFLPAIGWVGYDPTHNRQVDSSYVKIAIGRDYTDVRPLAGTFRGRATAQLEVSVKIDPIVPALPPSLG